MWPVLAHCDMCVSFVEGRLCRQAGTERENTHGIPREDVWAQDTRAGGGELEGECIKVSISISLYNFIKIKLYCLKN